MSKTLAGIGDLVQLRDRYFDMRGLFRALNPSWVCKVTIQGPGGAVFEIVSELPHTQMSVRNLLANEELYILGKLEEHGFEAKPIFSTNKTL